MGTVMTVAHEITVVIPSIDGRKKMLQKAIESVEVQTHHAAEIIVEHDSDKEGPAVVRNRAVEKVKTDWIAFLDDDDYFLPNHLQALCEGQSDSGADFIWPWFQTEPAGRDPFPSFFFGRQWNPGDPHQIPITTMIRTEAFRSIGGFRVREDHNLNSGEDWLLTIDLSAAGFRFFHVKERTWVWRHHGKNTSGLPSRW